MLLFAGLAHVLTLSLATTILASLPEPCRPPAEFKDAPHPPIEPIEQLVSHTEQIVIHRSLPVVATAMNMPLHQALRGSGSLPGVRGEYVLTGGDFGAPGSRRFVCLTDSTSVEEEALESEHTDTASRFRYVVWNFPPSRPVQYAVGEFRTTQLDAADTRIEWTYSFKLREDVFPGRLGALGNWLFRVSFLDRDYATMMRGVLAGYKEAAEKQ
jgi:hypothetical protein